MMSFAVMQRFAAAGMTLAFVGVSAARAQDSSDWAHDLHAAARLIAGASADNAGSKWLRAGIEVQLDPGWKTYWRDPGDSGIPPTFDFAESANVKSVAMQWPAPMRFDDGAGGYSIGYRDHVIWPLRIIPANGSMPTSLHVKLRYAVCGKLCVPAEADLTLLLTGEKGAEETVLAAAEARVPRRKALHPGTGCGEALAVCSAHREVKDGKQRVVVEVSAPQDTPVQLFAEGPTPDWALPLPEPDHSPASSPTSLRRRFTFALDGMPPGAQAEGATLTLTAVSPADAVEVKARLD